MVKAFLFVAALFIASFGQAAVTEIGKDTIVQAYSQTVNYPREVTRSDLEYHGVQKLSQYDTVYVDVKIGQKAGGNVWAYRYKYVYRNLPFDTSLTVYPVIRVNLRNVAK
jgi:hypothetical protein